MAPSPPRRVRWCECSPSGPARKFCRRRNVRRCPCGPSPQMASAADELARFPEKFLAIHCTSMYTAPMKLPKDLVAASAVPLVLSILAEGESYGYTIIQQVREVSDGAIEWTDGMLYPVLHRLEGQGSIHARWDKSETGRKRKYYALSRDGRQVLADQKEQWLTVHATLGRLWG